MRSRGMRAVVVLPPRPRGGTGGSRPAREVWRDAFACAGEPSVRAFARRGASGLTLVEIIVVMAIIAVVSGVAIGGSMQLPSARLRRSSTMIASAIKVAYTRATATSHDLRLVLDIDHQKIWLEQSDIPMLVKSADTNSTGGAEAITLAEKAALEAGDRILKGPPVAKARFRPVEAYGFGDAESGKGGKSLQRGITFRAVQTPHDDTARTAGRAYLYFWPGGRTERASIQLRIGDSAEESRTLTLLVSPLTGRVTVKAGVAPLEVPTDDDHASDRQDTGF
jgi:general secretion pathway protein H